MHPEQNLNPEKERVVFLDGIRGWASVMVLLSHLAVFFLANTVPGLKGWFFGFATDGNLAVFIFFVLSGFALSTGYVQSGKLSVLTSLTLRRYLRLAIPIFFSSLLAFALMCLGLFFNTGAGELSQNAWTSNFYTFQTSLLSCMKFALYDVFVRYDGAVSFNPVLWTMSIELWGSFVVFAICALVMHLRARMLILASIIGYLYVVNSIWYLPFVSGIAITLVHHRYGLSLNRYFRFAAPLLIGLIIYYSASTMRGGAFGLPAMPRADLYNILAASGLVLVAACTTQVRRFFESKLSKYLGSISFSLYLTHFMVICSFSSYLLIWLERFGLSRETSSAINFLVSVPACILVAHQFRHVENFAIAMARRFSTYMMRENRPEQLPAESAEPEPVKAV